LIAVLAGRQPPTAVDEPRAMRVSSSHVVPALHTARN
jgi:hypothetical protein